MESVYLTNYISLLNLENIHNFNFEIICAIMNILIPLFVHYIFYLLTVEKVIGY